VSGGFNPDRIAEFEKLQVPVDAYGVGSYLMRGVNAFTADVVLLEGRHCAKIGREYNPNPRLKLVES
jgi:nicotinate phosphoribosyltransferase